MYTSYKVESLINSLAVSANLWNVLKCFPNTHSLNCFFYLYQQKMNTCYHINQICCCPRNIYNFWTHYSTEYFSSYATIQIEHAIDMKVKGIYFINFAVNLQKQDFTRISKEFHIIRINITVIIFKFLIIKSL